MVGTIAGIAVLVVLGIITLVILRAAFTGERSGSAGTAVIFVVILAGSVGFFFYNQSAKAGVKNGFTAMKQHDVLDAKLAKLQASESSEAAAATARGDSASAKRYQQEADANQKEVTCLNAASGTDYGANMTSCQAKAKAG